MKLVIGCPVKDRAWILPSWFQAIEDETQHLDIETDVVCLYTPSEDDTLKVLGEWGARILYDGMPGRNVTEIDGHHWGTFSKYEYMSRLRNTLKDYVIKVMHADYFFSLDSDIILTANSLRRLLDFMETHEGVVAPAVNMMHNGTAWNTMSFANPQHPGGMVERPTKSPKSGQVDVVMAAMLMDRKGMQANWFAHDQGEDIGFSIDARQKSVPLWWMGDVYCEHVMRRR